MTDWATFHVVNKYYFLGKAFHISILDAGESRSLKLCLMRPCTELDIFITDSVTMTLFEVKQFDVTIMMFSISWDFMFAVLLIKCTNVH